MVQSRYQSKASTAPDDGLGAAEPTQPSGGSVGGIGSVLSAVFETTSALRRARTFHPKGIVVEAEVILPVDAGPPGFPDGPQRVLVRLSRGIGLPGALPDIPGAAVRFVDAGGDGIHQDLLLASTFDSPVGRMVLRPTTSFTSGMFTSLLPYEAGGQRVLFGARVDVDGRTAHDVDDLTAVLEHQTIEIALYWATPTSPWRAIGTLVLGPTGDVADLRSLAFDVTNCVPGIRPAGWLNRLRPAAYVGSRKGRGHVDTTEMAATRDPSGRL